MAGKRSLFKERGARTVLIVLAGIGILATILIPLFSVQTALSIITLMALAYASNASYSLQSRSGTRNSSTYHAFTILLSNFLFYSVLHTLVASNLTLALFIPYTVATVWGSATGAGFSMKIEKMFGITTDPNAKKEPKTVTRAKYGLLLVLGVGTIITAIMQQAFWLPLVVVALMFGDSMSHSWLRRARNTSSAWYHISISILKSTVWFFLFQGLASQGMALALFFPFSLGSVIGGISGQRTSMWLERLIGAKADAHVHDKSMKIIPWKAFFALALGAVVLTLLSPMPLYIAGLVLLAIGQQVAFSLVSRSRNRNNITYHVIASIFSNAVWFLTFRQIDNQNWTPDMYAPYAVGSALGSVGGVSAAMGIERKLKATSD